MSKTEFIKESDLPKEPQQADLMAYLLITGGKVTSALFAVCGVLYTAYRATEGEVENLDDAINEGGWMTILWASAYCGLTRLKDKLGAQYQAKLTTYEIAKVQRDILNKGLARVEANLLQRMDSEK
jgi:hypothetical protein